MTKGGYQIIDLSKYQFNFIEDDFDTTQYVEGNELLDKFLTKKPIIIEGLKISFDTKEYKLNPFFTPYNINYLEDGIVTVIISLDDALRVYRTDFTNAMQFTFDTNTDMFTVER